MEGNSRFQGIHYLYLVLHIQIGVLSIYNRYNSMSRSAKIDLQRIAYRISASIYPVCKKYLRFQMGQTHLQNKVLPFDLSRPAGMFSRILAIVMLTWRGDKGIIYPSLDNQLTQENSLQQEENYIHQILQLFVAFFSKRQTIKSSCEHWYNK